MTILPQAILRLYEHQTPDIRSLITPSEKKISYLWSVYLHVGSNSANKTGGMTVAREKQKAIIVADITRMVQ